MRELGKEGKQAMDLIYSKHYTGNTFSVPLNHLRCTGLQKITTKKISVKPRGRARQTFRALHQHLTFNDATANECRFVIRKQSRW